MRLGFTCIALLLLTACSAAYGPRDRIDRALAGAPGRAQPSEIVAADLAQNRLAQEHGVTEALRKTAADNAIVFAPDMRAAKEWLDETPNLPPTRWEPHEVFISCDGTLGVTTGAIRWGETDGYYTTVWRRSDSGSGKWEWVASHGDALETPRPRPDFIRTRIAECPASGIMADPTAEEFANRPANARYGQSEDRTLAWSAFTRPDGSRTLQVLLLGDDGFEPVLSDEVTASQARR